MKMKALLLMSIFILVISVVFAQQPTMLSLQGKATDSSGAPVNNGNLRVTLSTTDSCEQNVIYDYTYNSLIQKGLFSILLGNDSSLNLTYNQDYYMCTYVNSEIIKNAAGKNTTKFRGGHGQIPASNLANGTFANGNFTFAKNLTFGAGWFIKNDEDYLYRVIRAPIKFKDLVDRTANENVTGNWTFSGKVNISDSNSVIGGTPVSNLGGGEWVFVETRNISGSTTLGNLSGKVFKIVYYLNATTGIDVQINNITSASYDSKNAASQSTNSIFHTSGDTRWRITTLTSRARVYGSFVVSLDDVNSRVRLATESAMTNDYSQAEAVMLNGKMSASTISDITISGIDTGTITIFKSRYI